MSTDRLSRSVKATLWGLVTNTVLAVGKFAAGVVGNSHALIADAVESMADVVSSIIVWRGLVVAAAPPDEDHPYGHGKAEPIAAAIVSIMLLGAATWIAVKAVQEILTPHSSPAPFTLVVLVGVIVIKEGLFRFVLKEGEAVGSSAVQSDAWHHRSDAITSLAAGLGIGVSLLLGKGYEAADDYAALFASFIIAWNGLGLLRRALGELMDVVPDTDLRHQIVEAASTVDGVEAVQKCIVRQSGYLLFVDMHVHVDPRMPVVEAHEIAHRVKDTVRARVPRVHDVLIHIEPARR